MHANTTEYARIYADIQMYIHHNWMSMHVCIHVYTYRFMHIKNKCRLATQNEASLTLSLSDAAETFRRFYTRKRRLATLANFKNFGCRLATPEFKFLKNCKLLGRQ